MFDAIGGILGGIFGTSTTTQSETNANLQAQIDADVKKDKTQGVIGVSALLLSIVAIIVAFRRKG